MKIIPSYPAGSGTVVAPEITPCLPGETFEVSMLSATNYILKLTQAINSIPIMLPDLSKSITISKKNIGIYFTLVKKTMLHKVTVTCIINLP